jgi:uncharacterized membrane protein YgdD (TMEM256/DUF423 family)
VRNQNQFLGAIAILLITTIVSAFGAHTIKPKLSAEQINSLDTATLFSMVHGLAIMLLTFLEFKNQKWAFRLLFLGTIAFSGSIYAIQIFRFCGFEIQKLIWPITPIGGILLILAWSMVLINGKTIKK